MADHYPEHGAEGEQDPRAPAGDGQARLAPRPASAETGAPWADSGCGAPDEGGGPDPYGGPDDYDAAEGFALPDDDATDGSAGGYWAGPGLGERDAGRSGAGPRPAGPWPDGPASGPPGQFGAAARAGPGQAVPRSAPAAGGPAVLSGPPAPGAALAAGPGSRPAGTRRTVAEESVSAGLLAPGRHQGPSGGWRRAVAGVTGGLVRVPQPAARRRRRDLTVRALAPVSGGHHRVAVLSLKGGVGKTTTTIGLGSTLASLRSDRVIAVDANPDRGTLSDRLRLETATTVRDLLSERQQIGGYPDIRAYTTQAPSRLEVLGSDRDPASPAAFDEAGYRDVAALLEPYYAICLADCGTGLRHSAMTGVLRLADQIVLVSSPSVDGARSASAALDWLLAQGHGILARQAVMVLDVVRPRGKSAVDLARLGQQFAARCRAVVTVPYDPHLEEGAEVHLGRLNQATSDAFLALAAQVGDGFAGEPGPPR